MVTMSRCAACLRVWGSKTARSSQKIEQSLVLPQKHSRTILRTSRCFTTQASPLSSPNIHQVSPVVPAGSQTTTQDEPALEVSGNLGPVELLARKLRETAPVMTETYAAYSATDKLLKECARPADYNIPQAGKKGLEIPKTKEGEDLGVGKGWWYEEFGLFPTFNNWAQVTFLHMWLITVSIRCFPPELAPIWHQHLVDHFSYFSEDRMTTLHNIQSRATRNNYLKDLFLQWRGVTAAYDEGMMKGDAVLAAAVWRNVCKGDPDVDLVKLGCIVSYMRSVLSALENMGFDVIKGDVVFGDPSSEISLVMMKSKMMDQPFAPNVEMSGKST